MMEETMKWIFDDIKRDEEEVNELIHDLHQKGVIDLGDF
jgi:hypothetical protein